MQDGKNKLHESTFDDYAARSAALLARCRAPPPFPVAFSLHSPAIVRVFCVIGLSVLLAICLLKVRTFYEGSPAFSSL